MIHSWLGIAEGQPQPGSTGRPSHCVNHTEHAINVNGHNADGATRLGCLKNVEQLSQPVILLKLWLSWKKPRFFQKEPHVVRIGSAMVNLQLKAQKSYFYSLHHGYSVALAWVGTRPLDATVWHSSLFYANVESR